MANVYEKLQAARVALQTQKIAKSGKNSHAGYSYHELSDFLPHVNRILHEQKLCSIVTFDAEQATLTVVNAEKPDETITFTSPMAEASLRGVQPIQNVGAVQTYQRRYLYMTALEIVEHDALDASAPDETTERPRQAKTQTNGRHNGDGKASRTVEDALKAYFAACGDKISSDEAKELLKLTAWKRTGTYPGSSKKCDVALIDKVAERVRKADADKIKTGLNALYVEWQEAGPSDDVPELPVDPWGEAQRQAEETQQASLLGDEGTQ